MSPKREYIQNYNIMKKIKEDLFLEREKVLNKMKKENPRDEHNLDKLNSLVEKEMNETYKEKFNIIMGKKKRSNTAETNGKEKEKSDRYPSRK